MANKGSDLEGHQCKRTAMTSFEKEKTAEQTTTDDKKGRQKVKNLLQNFLFTRLKI